MLQSNHMLDIIKVPTISLREVSKEISREFLLEKDIQQFISEMIPTMYADDGIGLAAPQVAQNIRICVIGKGADSSLDEDLILVNPVWTPMSRKRNTDIEGCLSVPNIFGKVKRYTHIKVNSWNRQGDILEFLASNFFARVIQHEVDHLNGILFIDKATGMYEGGQTQLL